MRATAIPWDGRALGLRLESRSRWDFDACFHRETGSATRIFLRRRLYVADYDDDDLKKREKEVVSVD